MTGPRSSFKISVSALIWVWFLTFCLGQNYDLDPRWRQICPRMYLSIFNGYAPRGNDTAGVYTKKDDIHRLEDCITSCCTEEMCNVIFMHDDACYQIICDTSEMCAPLYRPEKQFGRHVSMVLVQPVSATETWDNVLDSSWADDFRNKDSTLDAAESSFPTAERRDNCEVGIIVDCPKHEICVPIATHSRNGVCQCVEDYQRNSSGLCQPIICDTSEMCAPLYRPEKQFGRHVSMVLVQPVSATETWDNVLDSSWADDFRNKDSTLDAAESSFPTAERRDNCEVGIIVDCPKHEICVPIATHSRNGVCQCVEDYQRNSSGLCQPVEIAPQDEDVSVLNDVGQRVKHAQIMYSEGDLGSRTDVNIQDVTSSKPLKQLVVSVVSKEVRLPENAVTLSAYTVPAPQPGEHYKYEWTLVSQPEGVNSGTMNDQNGETLKLNKLIEGLYKFKVSVSAPGAYGETHANVTVLPRNRINQPPVAVISPSSQTVKLPNTGAVLDGSTSKDDDRIVNWHWELQQGPLGYQPHLKDTPTLQLDNLVNTRTPYLQLSNLEEGMYTFVLKVTDNSGQSSSAEVHVFVKPPTNKPPVANAGADATVSLPQTLVLLDGSQSSDDIKITNWQWEQIRGPSKASFSASNSSITNATDLTKGEYEFMLTVTDDNGNKASDSVIITVNQNKNAKPKANAGGDQTILLPVSVIILNGSQSSDDLGIVKWEWLREQSSLALGKVIANTDHSPVLMLTDVVPGRYVFRLIVTDDQGLSDEDTVSVIVKNDPHLFHLVELTLNIEGRMLTKQQESSLEMKLSLLLHEEAVINVRDLRMEDRTGRAVIVFYVEQKGGKGVIPGPTVVERLKAKLTQDSGLLELSVANIQTAICQNNCSGHGVCDQVSRLCQCEAFWMQDLITKYLGSGDSNCDWSILYVVIVLFTSVVVIVGGGWGLVCLCQRACARRPRKRQRYSLLDEGEDDAMIPRVTAGKMMISESDSDSDVLFESRKCKQNGDARNGHGKMRNGFVKMGRRIKT
ncbi:hypothetical protein C0J52_04994 [Blattella germanica]|nr:hypothetical protein C0J52_04994 [Blattella germanica]